jgi:hypothetical protein
VSIAEIAAAKAGLKAVFESARVTAFTLSGMDRFVERLHELDAAGSARIVVFGEESPPA